MAGHKTHAAVGMATAAALAVTSPLVGAVPAAQQPLLLACGVAAGLAPDLDSDTSRPLQILKGAIGTVVVGVVLADSLRRGLTMFASAGRIGVAVGLVALFFALFTRLTTHRGIMHSVPFVCLWALVIMQASLSFGYRLSLAAGVISLAAGLGHLLLDELWAVDLKGLRPRLKATFGTAFKFWSASPLATAVCYAALAAMVWVTLHRH